MKILFLHPEDEALRGPWAGRGWDRVIDLGMAGPETYRRWSEFFQCPVENFGFARMESEPVREALAAGLGYVCDAYGVDWWEVISIMFAQRLFEVSALHGLVASIAPGDEVFISRPGFFSRVLELQMGSEPECLSRPGSGLGRVKGFYEKVRRLSVTQIRQMLADKYDSEYRARRKFASRRARCEGPVVLLPSAYVNVSRMAMAYAESLPERDFVLIAARRNAECESRPGNVAQATLESYLGRERRDEAEYRGLVGRWRELLNETPRNALLHVLLRTGVLEDFEQRLHQWLVVRDAWLNVLESEPVSAVLSCDDSNPYTHIPLLLAKEQGLPAITVHHGALDAQHRLKRSHADVVLAKGEMERDYLVRACGVPRRKVEVGAPARRSFASAGGERSAIVFFSEDYEVSGGRVEEFYRDVLPGLAELARANGKELVIKLHPAENLRERTRFAKRVLSREQFAVARMVTGKLTDELLRNAWFAVTVISTTAVDCASRGIPVFLCGWLENWPCGYLEQFAAFGVGRKLREPSEISGIPRLLETIQVCDSQSLWEAIDPEHFQEILGRGVAEKMPAAV